MWLACEPGSGSEGECCHGPFLFFQEAFGRNNVLKHVNWRMYMNVQDNHQPGRWTQYHRDRGWNFLLQNRGGWDPLKNSNPNPSRIEMVYVKRPIIPDPSRWHTEKTTPLVESTPEEKLIRREGNSLTWLFREGISHLRASVLQLSTVK